ncbi:MAG: Nif3-like dinuclear metal center hexameric protein [Lachnospiraceae bacterium]|nr:Nif3-like dinuclear metal center hexameric protein [Lachnospiraceae bacterium]
MRCSEIIRALFELAPERYAEEWDNVGLLVGRPDKKVKKICLAVDATDEVIEQAHQEGADMLLTHHPMIFHPLKKITSEDFVSRRVVELIRDDISYCAMHTNFDISCMGKAAAERLGLLDCQVLQPVIEEKGEVECSAPSGGGDHIRYEIEEKPLVLGYGRVGRLQDSMSLSECADLVRERFSLPGVRVFGKAEESVETIAILPGSGGSFVADAISCDADVLITGDIGHHQGIDAVMQGISVIDAGHYGIEKIFIGFMRHFFSRNFPELSLMSLEDEPFRVQ